MSISRDRPLPEIDPRHSLPAALPLFASGLAGLGLFGWRRKRKLARELLTTFEKTLAQHIADRDWIRKELGLDNCEKRALAFSLF